MRRGRFSVVDNKDQQYSVCPCVHTRTVRSGFLMIIVDLKLPVSVLWNTFLSHSSSSMEAESVFSNAMKLTCLELLELARNRCPISYVARGRKEMIVGELVRGASPGLLAEIEESVHFKLEQDCSGSGSVMRNK